MKNPGSAFLRDEARDRIHEIEFREHFEFARLHLDKNRGTFVAQQVRDALDRRIRRNLGQRRAHHFVGDARLPG